MPIFTRNIWYECQFLHRINNSGYSMCPQLARRRHRRAPNPPTLRFQTCPEFGGHIKGTREFKGEVLVGRAMAAFGNHTHGLFGYWPTANTPKNLFVIRLTSESADPHATAPSNQSCPRNKNNLDSPIKASDRIVH